MTKHLFLVPVQARAGISAETIAKVLDSLLNIGLADATATVDSGEGDVIAAQQALDLNISSPHQLLQNESIKLLEDMDSYLREIRAENLDGSEPALGELLEKGTDFWLLLNQPAGELTPAVRRTEALKALKSDGLTFGECIEAFADKDDDPFVGAAQNKVREGELEVDSPTVVSRGDDDGAYVMGWIWVSNEAAGIVSNAELLEQVLDHARLALAGQHGLDTQTEKLRNDQADWLEELISNFADELDDIESEVLKGVPGAITWVNGEGDQIRFMPSDALFKLLPLARQNGLSIELSNQAETFCSRYGNKLDAILTAVQTA